ncbi:thiamine phosphate synthase [Geobacter argillaceus]|uniref:Thiamine-phosphate synthase n=1 Tax=Geobacter argillaceus TaxID=345631 RepID=A0A562WRE9_9BACT|nr:thiamine phosphate synthase [Geobacter argillaceus]TWJ32397.1 thiamine-phosphate diphosphorylase [Geobacter argillaceus]
MSTPIDFTLYLITDRLQTGTRTLLEVVEEALAGGVKAVQLREKDLTGRELYELAFDMKKLTSRYGANLLINDRIDIALAVDADGVHLGSGSIPIYRARKLLGKNRLIGVSCHNQVNAITAQEKGADFITFGPVFYTASKAKYGKPVGIDKLESVSHLLTIPVFAIGGVNATNTREVLATGATGIALISAIIAAHEPRQAAQTLLSLLPAAIVTP